MKFNNRIALIRFSGCHTSLIKFH